MTAADYVDDLAFLANTSTPVESLLRGLKQHLEALNTS